MRVAITGGTGTLGHALTRWLLSSSECERIAIISRDEVKQAMMALEFGAHSKLRFFLGDVRDRARLDDAFYSCDTVIHAAALKRVDAIAYNPQEVRKTNIEGSANVIAAALHAGVKKVVMVSSDKACYPTNAYGVSKAQMEHEAIASNAITWPRGTAVACTRYGNVLGSRGSVVQAWQQAIEEKRPIPLTDIRMTRFWLTVESAVSTIMFAVSHMKGGEIFVPAMPGMRLLDLAEAMAPDRQCIITGLRSGGEKIYETVITAEEAERTSCAGNMIIINPDHHPWRADAPWPQASWTTIYDGWRCSNTTQQLSVADMRKMLEGIV